TEVLQGIDGQAATGGEGQVLAGLEGGTEVAIQTGGAAHPGCAGPVDEVLEPVFADRHQGAVAGADEDVATRHGRGGTDRFHVDRGIEVGLDGAACGAVRAGTSGCAKVTLVL